jgi:PAS domain S-box-containing protein
VLAVLRDITKQVQAEQQLREREEQYRSVFEATSDGLDILDLDGFIVEVNPAFCGIYGYTREELIGMNVSTLVPQTSHHIATEGLETLKAGRDYRVTADAQGLRKDGTMFFAEAHGIPFTYRGQRHILGVVRDITERVEAERQLREKEELYRSIFEATYDGIDILDLDGFYVEVNPAFCRMFG